MSITQGSSSAPSQVTQNLDALFSQSLSGYKPEMQDNIGATNAFLFEMMKKDLYESQEGVDVRVPLMYQLTPADWFDGYTELSTNPTDGVTEAIAQWRQIAAPISYSEKERKQNKRKITSLVQTKIKQAEMGLQEAFAQAIMWGAGTTGGNLYDPVVGTQGDLGVDPLFLHIMFDPTISTSIDNINQNTSSWWRNKTKTSSATTYDNLMLEWNHTFNMAALGTGGKPKVVLADQTTYEAFCQAYFLHYRQTLNTDANYPFENVLFKGAHIVMDDKVPDVYTNVNNATTYGTAVFINSEFFKLIYEPESDFVMLKDDSGKTMFKPVNGDSRVGHVAWMGQTMSQNRRKQSILGKIARTFTA